MTTSLRFPAVDARRPDVPPPAQRPCATIVPLAGAARRNRPAPGPDEARGEILLFLGVRYERLAS